MMITIFFDSFEGPDTRSKYGFVFGTLFWFLYYATVCYFLSQKSAEFCNRIVTFTHGLTTALMGINECFVGSNEYWEKDQTDSQSWLLSYSLGYFLFDLTWCLYYQTETALMITHHCCSCVFLYRIISAGHPGSQSCCALGCLELSNPLLQARWFVRTFGYYQTPLYNSIEITFIFVFVVVRIVFGTFFMTGLILYPGNDLEFKLIALVMYILSWMFVFNIIRYVSSKYMRTQVISIQSD